MEILARAVGRRKEAVAQVQLVRGTGQFFINDKPAHAYLQNNSCSLICIKSPLQAALSISYNPANTVGVSGDISSTNDIPLLELANFSENLESKKILLEEQKGIQTELQELPSSGASSLDQISVSQVKTNNFSLYDNIVKGVDIIIKVKGGGLIGQAEAIQLGVARAFCIMENSSGEAILRKILKTKGYLTQDSRVKERRKYGLKKARKASQYHKR